MKYFYLWLLLIFFGISGFAQIVNIPDAALKSKLTSTTCASFTGQWPFTDDVDTNNDGEIQLTEAQAVTALAMGGAIGSAVGLEAFTNLVHLNLSSNYLTDFTPLEGLSSLRYLKCTYSAAPTINLSQLGNLEEFYGNNSQWTSLDFSQTKVVDFDLNGCNQLTYVNLKNGYMSTCDFGPDDGCTQWFFVTSLVAVCRDEGELTPGFGYQPLPWGVINSYCSFAPGGQFNTVSGQVTLDCNGMNIPMRNIPVIATEGGDYDTTIFSSSQGEYLYYMGNGEVTVTPQLSNPAYFLVSPPNFTYEFTDLDSAVAANFCVVPTGSHPDLEISISEGTVARPGFDADYYIIYKNKGTELQSGSITATFNDNLTDFVSAIPNVASQSSGQLNWNFIDLQPFETRSIALKLNLNSPMETPAVNIGDVLNFTATVAAGVDETPLDNTMQMSQTVVGSFDPNDKAVSRQTIGITELNGYLYYTIRFQNTGTFAAENVVIKDVLSNNLNWSTLEIVATSHTGHRNLGTDNILEFFFEGINLPAVADNEPASHGYVIFKIKPKNSLAIGNTIENHAEIYFDFNFPIVTNSVTTTVTSLGIDTISAREFTLFPNPGEKLVTIDTDQQIESVKIYNALGQLVKTTSETRIDISALASGSYFVKITSSNGSVTKKLVKL